jgi:hypothetical protein
MRSRHLFAVALLVSAGSALGQDLNLISSVEVQDEGASVVLAVKGTKPANFTTFSMADPPRFVVDLSEAKFQGVPQDLEVNDGTILVVKNLSYGSDASSIARIMIAFAVDVDPPDVQTQGTTLVVRIVKPAGTPGMTVAKADAAQQPAVDAQAQAQAEAEAKARAEAEAAARAEADAAARAEAEAAARAEAQAQADAQRRAEEEAAAKAQAEAERRAQEEAVARAEAEKAAAGDAETKAAAAATAAALLAAQEAQQAEARAAEEESARQRQEAMAAAQADAERAKQEEADREAEAKRQREEAVAAAKAEAERKKQEEADRKAEAKRQREEAIAAAKAEAEQKKQEAAERAAEAKRQREEARLAAAQARDEALAAEPPSAQLREIGFRQLPGGSRVFVRTSVQPRFTIQDVGENMIRVELENTRVVRRNDARFLDTSFFPSAVALITPSRRGSSYVVDIKLKEKVPYQQRIEGDMLAIDFERPAGAVGAALQPAAAEEDALPIEGAR